MSGRVGTVVVGAGPAGLATSARLAAAGHDHVVLERGRVGESWRTQRWDAFRLNTPGWMNGLDDEHGFATAAELVGALEQRAGGLPVREHAPVLGVWRRRGGGYLVATPDEVLVADHVVAASGAQRVPRLPAIADHVTGRGVEHLHTADYRRAGDLPEGGVLVVGSGSSGGQIAADLLASGRRVLVATSAVPRTPRRYRGRDVMEWAHARGRLDQATEAVAPHERRLPQVLVGGGVSLSLQTLARGGAELLGRLAGADGTRLGFTGSPVELAAFADAEWAGMRAQIDGFIAEHGIDAPAAEDDELPLTRFEAPGRDALDLAAEGIGTVIWATGFAGDFGWLRMPILDGRGLPVHRGVATPSAGLFTVGLPWLVTRTSSRLYGIDRDAASVAAAITGVRGDARELVAA